MENTSLCRRHYDIAGVCLAAVFLGGVVWCCARPGAYVFLMVPALAAVGTALAWVLLMRFALLPHAPRRTQPTFCRALKYGTVMPVWTLLTLALFLVPEYTSDVNDDLATAFSMLLVGAFLTVVPLAVIVCSVLGLVYAVRHMKAAGEQESWAYRDGPFVLALLLCVCEVTLLVFLVAYALM